MPTVWIRVYEELNEHLPARNRKRTFAHELPEGATVSQLLADLGIPASEVDLVLAGDVSIALSHRVREGERISIYPVFERFEIGSVTAVRSSPLRSPKFLAEHSLRRLAGYLRFLGFDATTLEPGANAPERFRQAEAEHRTLLTLAKNAPGGFAMSRVLGLKEENAREQLREVYSRLDLYRAAVRHSWEVTPADAIDLQGRLRDEIVIEDETGPVQLVGGVDVAFEENDTIARAAIAVLSFPELELCDSAVVRVPVSFPYIPGLLSFRETPASLEAMARLRRIPDLLFCDGHGYAHPRRFGMACHVGVLTGIPTIGIAKGILVGSHGELPARRGAWVPLVDKEEIIGAAVRTRHDVKPVYVSVGNRVSLNTAIEYVLRCSRYRLPEPARWADRLSRIKSL